MPSLIDAIRSRIVVMDGAMGTRLQARGLDPSQESSASWCLTRPEEVRAVHTSYIEAGAEVLVANTFVAADTETRRAGINLARGVAEGRWVLLDVGPISGLPRTTGEARAALNELPLIDGVLLDTFSEVESLTIAEAFAGTGVPVILSLAYRRTADGIRSFDGESPEFFARHAIDAGVSVIGVNCGREMLADSVVEVVHRYRDSTTLPVMARPNAGTPPRSATILAEAIPDWIHAGATLLGGCCGTDADFIRAITLRCSGPFAIRPPAQS